MCNVQLYYKQQNTVTMQFMVSRIRIEKYLSFFFYKMSESDCTNVSIFNRIGGGTYGQVYKARFRDEAVVAKKILKNENYISIDSGTLYDLVFTKMLHNPNIIEMKGICHHPTYNELYIEEMDSDLLKWITTVDFSIRLHNIRGFIRDMSSALNEFFKNYLVHNDIKPQNILVKHIGGNKYIFKLADLGFTTPLFQIKNVKFFGTRVYTAPEGLIKNYTTRDFNYEKIDIWSIGMVLYNILFKKTYLQGNTDEDILKSLASKIYVTDTELIEGIIHQTVNQEIYITSPKVPDDIIELLNNMLKINVSDRISMRQLCKFVSTESCGWRNLQVYNYKQYIPIVQFLSYMNVSTIQDRMMAIYIINKLHSLGYDNYYYVVPYIASIFWNNQEVDPRNYIFREISIQEFDTTVYEVLKLVDYDIYKPFMEVNVRDFTKNFTLEEFTALPYHLTTKLRVYGMYEYYKNIEAFQLPTVIIRDAIVITRNLPVFVRINHLFFVLSCVNRLRDIGDISKLDMCLKLANYFLTANAKQTIDVHFVEIFNQVTKDIGYRVDYVSPTLNFKAFEVDILLIPEFETKVQNFLLEKNFMDISVNLYQIFVYNAFLYFPERIKYIHQDMYNEMVTLFQ